MACQVRLDTPGTNLYSLLLEVYFSQDGQSLMQKVFCIQTRQRFAISDNLPCAAAG